jgi:hypothetical protein
MLLLVSFIAASVIIATPNVQASPGIINVPSGYAKIQWAVGNATTGDTIIVAAGTYDEQVVIDKSLTLQGAGDATVIKPSSAATLTQVFTGLFWYGTPDTKNIAGIIVANVLDGSNVTIKNLKVDESSVTTNPTGSDYLTGIFYRETGGTIDTVNIVGTGAWSGSDRAYGIYLSAATNTASVQIKGSTITNWDKNAIEAMGSKLTFNIHDNVLTGRGGVTDEVQNGINAGRGSVGTVNSNTISNMVYGPETWWCAGIMFYNYLTGEYGSGSVANNTITNCQIGVFFKNCNGTAQGNTVNGGTVGLLGLWAEYTQAGTWTASFVKNTVSGVRDSPGWENGAIGAATYDAGASLTVTIDDNQLIGEGATEDADGIYIGDIPPYPAGTITTIIKGNVISGWQNGTHLVSSVDTGSSISGNTITNNNVGIQVEAAVNAANILANYNNIYGNVVFGVRNLHSSILNAEHNWWGNVTGPYHSTANPGGGGDKVSDNVDFTPWLSTDYPPAKSVATTTGTGTASFTPSQGAIEDLTAVPTPPGAPADLRLPHGMFSFKVTGLTPGQTVTITITLPTAVPVGTKWWKYQAGAWYSMPIGSDNGDNIITISLTDGVFPGDSDNTANGVIIDPGGPGFIPVGGIWAPISTLQLLAPWIAIALIALAAAAAIAGTRRFFTKRWQTKQ